MSYMELFELASYVATAAVGVLMIGDRAAGAARRWTHRRAEWRRLEPERQAAAWRAGRLRESRAAVVVVGGRPKTF